MNLVVYIAAVVSIGGFLAALEFHTNFYVLYPIAALIGLVQSLIHCFTIPAIIVVNCSIVYRYCTLQIS